MEFLKLDHAQSIELIKATVNLAHLARTQYLNVTKCETIPWIVGSIGPYGAHLHDGSEYTGSYSTSVSAERLQEWHRQRIEAVIAAGVDCLAIETIPCPVRLKCANTNFQFSTRLYQFQIEAEAVAEYLSKHHPTMRFWISFQCKEDGQCIANGEPFATTARKLWHHVRGDLKNGNLLAIGVNCVNPKVTLKIDGAASKA
jgi:S-methylmethionine-dependent homocysteine/selenocysteine methylase